MSRFVVDTSVVLHLVATSFEVAPGHELLAPTLLRSQVLSALHEAVDRGDLTDEVARDHLDRITGMKMRLLGDAVMRSVAWEVADEQGWASTYVAEYVALTRLQADALVTLDDDVAAQVDGLVPIASVSALG